MTDYIDIIIENPTFKSIVLNINTYLHSIITNPLMFIGIMLLISLGIGYLLSTKLLTKTSITIGFTVLVYFMFRYIGMN